MLEKLIELRRAWMDEIIAAEEDKVPEITMRQLLETEKELRKEIAKLEEQAADIIRRYQI